MVEGAWSRFEEGDLDGYLDAVANAAREHAIGFDTVMLAQASMAPVADMLGDLPIRVLCSPRLGVDAAVRAYHASVPG